jgi:glycosyltransferase involved in cell wall biosynthesis
MLGDPRIKLHLYTALTIDQLEARGISGPIVYHPHHAESEMPQIQRQADLLFLPLAFNSPYPDLIRTSATTKLGEYLAARRPILAHAPADSFVSWYFRRHECGMVVDELNTEKLAQALERIINDVGLQQRLATRAWEQAKSDFDIVTAQAVFAKLLKLDRPGTDRSQHSAYWAAEVGK